jgi:pimeloyl-ACP methyl ester carboxylesterase
LFSRSIYLNRLETQKWIKTWLPIANRDHEFRLASEGLKLQFLFQIEKEEYIFHLDESGLIFLGDSQFDESWDFAIRAPAETWNNLLSSLPPPGSQSIISLRATDSNFRWEGNMVSGSQALHALQRLLEILREFSNGLDISPKNIDGDFNGELNPVERNSGLINGHYIDLYGYADAKSKVYYEESGKGIPIVLLHTACGDSRQYHDLLSDVELARNWHMFAFDLPFHGRSMPPDGWWKSKYILTKDIYAEWCISFIKNVICDQAVVLGCSMGAVMAVNLAQYRQHVRAVIGFEAPDHSPARKSRFICHPKVNQAAHNPTYAYGLMSPTSPEVYRKRLWWYYSQSGYGVYDGDLYFYNEEWDGATIENKIDTKECPVYLFSGDYDYSAPQESVKRLAERITGAKFKIINNIGHFPMSENPDLFRLHLFPVLEEIKSIFKKTG